MCCTVPINLSVFQYLKDADIVNENTVTKPNEVQQEDLLLVHTARYLKSLKVKLKYGSTHT
jgi:acetoin utilization deacetylase AcuC-like enzyme